MCRLRLRLFLRLRQDAEHTAHDVLRDAERVMSLEVLVTLFAEAIAEALRSTLSWAIEQVTRWERPYEHVVARLGLS